jgi:YVTN family beta-propeller protein
MTIPEFRFLIWTAISFLSISLHGQNTIKFRDTISGVISQKHSLQAVSYKSGECPPGEIPDCNGNCYLESWIGDGVCDDGFNFPSDFLCEEFNFDEEDCIGPGCTDPTAFNFNPVATSDDGSCVFTFDFDCDGNFINPDLLELYLNNWHCNNGFWTGAGFDVGGDVDLNCALHEYDNGECKVHGCTDPDAINFYEHADVNDGSCLYGTCPEGTEDCMGNCIPEHAIAFNSCPDGASNNPVTNLMYGAYPDNLLFNIPVDNSPRGMCVLPDGSKAFIGASDYVTVINLQNLDNGTWTTESIYVGGLAYTCSPSQDGQFVYVANWGLGIVQIINVATNIVVESIDIGIHPLKVVTSHDGDRILVSQHDGNSVVVIDATTWEVLANIPVGINPRNICTSMDDNYLYSANWGSNNVTVVDLNNFSTVATVPVDYWPQAIWPTPDGKYIFVANFGFDFSYDHISVIRTSDNQVIARLQTGAGTEDIIALGDHGQYLYASNWGMPCCFFTTSDYCCSAEVNKGTLTVIAVPDFEMWVAADSIPTEIPYLQSTLTTVNTNAEYSFGMSKHPNNRYVFTVNKDSNTLSVVGMNNDVSSIPINSWHKKLNIVPNPAGESFYIDTEMAIDKVELIGLNSQLIRKWENITPKKKLVIEDLLPGFYIIRISFQGAILVRKLVVS